MWFSSSRAGYHFSNSTPCGAMLVDDLPHLGHHLGDDLELLGRDGLMRDALHGPGVHRLDLPSMSAATQERSANRWRCIPFPLCVCESPLTNTHPLIQEIPARCLWD